jgi:putative transposase
MGYPLHYPDFFTATILQWQHLLKQDKYKHIIIDCLCFLVLEKKVEVFGFAIMSNHIHIVWRAANDNTRTDVQQSFMKFTAQTILKDIKVNHEKVLPYFYVGAKDRQYQIWERNPLSIEIRSNEVMFQKLNYIHQNPVKAGICEYSEQYRFSSASIYIANSSEWDFVTKWIG